MKFTIGYGFADGEDVPETILMGEDERLIRHMDTDAPELPSRFKMQYENFDLGDDVQIGFWTVEIDTLEDLLEIARHIGREVTLEQQPAGMRDLYGDLLPEFCLAIGESTDREDSDENLDN